MADFIYRDGIYKRYGFKLDFSMRSNICVICDKVYKQRMPHGTYRGAIGLVRAQLRSANRRDAIRHYEKTHPNIPFNYETGLIVVDKDMAKLIDDKRNR